MVYFLLPPSHINGDGSNWHVFKGNKEANGNCTMETSSECGLVSRNKQANCGDTYFATEYELKSFFNSCNDRKICANCSDMHKHADPK